MGNDNAVTSANDNYTACMHNRELSWLQFNKRVLDEANYEPFPLYERLKFIAIFISNLDEFYRVRVGSLLDYALYDPEYFDNKTGKNAREQLEDIYRVTTLLYRKKDEIYNLLSQKITKQDIGRVHIRDIAPDELKFIEKYFKNNILPLLSPQVVDNRHPFPHIDNKQLNIAVRLSSKSERTFGIIPVPSMVDRLVFLPSGECRYILVEDIIYHFAGNVFKMYNITEKAIISVTRNADIKTDVGLLDEDIDYRQHMKKVIKKRAKLSPVRLELGSVVTDEFVKYLVGRFKVDPAAVFFSSTPLSMSYVFSLQSRLPAHLVSTLCTPEYIPAKSASIIEGQSMLSQIAKRDILLSYPFESIDPFIKLLKEAADDPNVLSIKITLYRISKSSRIANYLIRAVENEKEVIVVMELRARFDEENNIEWAGRLAEAGCQVVYGLDGYKVHSKICLITRKENNRIVHYTQVGTGNYNEKTSKLYTDLSIMTVNEGIGSDADDFFKNMCMSNLNGSYKHLWVAPNALKQPMLDAIEGEIIKASQGKPARIIIKINSFTDRDIIVALIKASQAGVKIDLIVRGICCLIPGIEGYTENVNVISIVGRFLEHSRIYCFGEGKDASIYIASADMMTRNTQRRVEIACPIYDPAIKERVFSMLMTMLSDNIKAHQLKPSGKYILRRDLLKATTPQEQRINSQEYFVNQAQNPPIIIENASKEKKHGFWGRIFKRKR